MLIAIPLIPLVRETYLFLRPRVRFEGWDLGLQRPATEEGRRGGGVGDVSVPDAPTPDAPAADPPAAPTPDATG